MGIVVLLDDGFVALAGDTGEELWQYRVGDNARAAYASHAGDYLAVETEGSETGPSLVELDPSTGEVLQEIAIEESSSGDSGIDAGAFSRNVAHGVRIARDPFDDPALRAVALDTGENLWVQQEPPECTTIEATNSDTTVGMVMGDIVLEGYSCAGGDDGAGLLGRDLTSGEELWRFEEGFGSSDPELNAPERRYDPLTDQYLAVRTQSGATRVFDVATGEVFGEWDGAVIGVLEDESVVIQFGEDSEYQRTDRSGTVLEALSMPHGTSRTEYPVALEGGVVGHGSDTRDSEARVWFHAWGNDAEPTNIDVSDAGLEDDEAVLSATAAPGAVVLSYSEDGTEGREVLLGLI
ncbi:MULTISPECIES: outer membrane protein assembly factor BamB family protein [Nocardiopsidaceae]|uniref:PQQ-binding-like beta-propeller repeat protein n=1 Tax=Streptomonospora nanhaiensis TaxID=1323731 RepID=A0ABY6YTU3_9ACTN|nr:PQQ-binding-like beta-propeller repeat protein [Streptomonospora nanhaiensis]WAE75822.1 PQQ-binding-like beta-propeller repeat protein [Streptomonospora nanhaiensis]